MRVAGIGGAALLAASIVHAGQAGAQARATPAALAGKPPVAAVKPVTETFFGTKLTDPYRSMATPGDPETVAWMKAQGEFTRGVLDAVPARAPYLAKLSALGGQFGLVNSYRQAGGRAFYLAAKGDECGPCRLALTPELF